MARDQVPLGRERELARARRRFLDTAGKRVLFVHGPGGIGKSTFARAVAAEASMAGFEVWSRAGADLAASTEPLEQIVARLDDPDRPQLLVVDGCEDLDALVGLLRHRVASRLGAAHRLIVVSRERPEAQWHGTRWDPAVLAVDVSALDVGAAATLARTYGVDPDAARRIAVWSGGLPLAVVLAADLVASGDLEIAGLGRDPALGAVLLDHLLGRRMEASRRRVLATAAIAGAVDDRLLRAVLPEVGDGEAWLRGLPYAVATGSRVRLHDTVAAVITRALASTAPDEDVELRRRLADSYLRRALAGDPSGIVALGTLVRDETLAWGLGGAAGRDVQATQARPDEADRLLAQAGLDPEREASTRRWFAEAPEYVVVSRWADGTPAGFGIVCTTRRRPGWAPRDPVLGPWLAAAEREYPGQIAFLARDVVDFGGPADAVSGPMAAGYPRVMLSFGAENPVATYATGGHKPSTGTGTEPWLAAMGYRPHPDLGAGAPVDRCWIADHGAGGIAGDTWRVVLRDLGITPPPALPVPDLAHVRALLRGWRDPTVLAASPLGHGTSTAERARRTRARVLQAVAEVDAADELLGQVLRRTFLDADAGVATALRELPLSRATYYRRLKEAVAQVTAWLT